MKDLELNEMFKVALDAMQNEFTGDAFAEECRPIERKFKNIKQKRAKFLQNNTKQTGRRTYVKMNIQKSAIFFNEDDCVNYLKSLGNYTIYREEIQLVKL